MREMDLVQHGADVVVGRSHLHAEQPVAVRQLPPFNQRALVREERLTLHEEQREGQQADVDHGVGDLATTPLVGNARAHRPHAVEKGLEYLHDSLGSRLSTMHHTRSPGPLRTTGAMRPALLRLRRGPARTDPC